MRGIAPGSPEPHSCSKSKSKTYYLQLKSGYLNYIAFSIPRRNEVFEEADFTIIIENKINFFLDVISSILVAGEEWVKE